MKKLISILLTVTVLVLSCSVLAEANGGGYLLITDFIEVNSGKDVSAEINAVIEANPNRTIFFPDGEYLIAKPLLTPAHPKKSVSLKLADFAVLRATGEWTKGEAVVQLGATHPANDTHTPGSNYSFEGGIIDGSGVADGISINGGRETAVRQVSMKNVVTGVHILYGANSGSSDADVSELNIICTGKTDSTGILAEGYDNTFTNIRIGAAFTGVRLCGGGNKLTSIHPLYQSDYTDYENSCAFLDESGCNVYDYCYSDQYGIGFRTTNNTPSRYTDCFCFWYSPKGDSHTAFKADQKFNSIVTTLRADFPDSKNNYLLQVGKIGGSGKLINPDISPNEISSKVYKAYAFNDKPFEVIARIFWKFILLFKI